MLDRVVAEALDRPANLLTAAAVALLLSIGVATSGPGTFGVGSGPAAGAPDFFLRIKASEPLTTATGSGIALRTVESAVGGDPAVASIKRTFGGRKKLGATLEVRLRGGSTGDREHAALRIAGGLDPGPLGIAPGGSAFSLQTAREAVLDDLWRIGLVVGPFLLLALIAALGWRFAAVTAGVAALSIAGSAALLRLAGALHLLAPSEAALIPAAVVGLAIAVEAGVVFAALYEALCRGEDESQALQRSARIAGWAAVWSAAAAAIVLASLAAFGIGYLTSAAFAGILAAVLAAVASLAVFPAALSLWGDTLPGFSEAGLWDRLAGLVTWRRRFALPILLIALALIALQSVPGQRAELTALEPAAKAREDPKRGAKRSAKDRDKARETSKPARRSKDARRKAKARKAKAQKAKERPATSVERVHDRVGVVIPAVAALLVILAFWLTRGLFFAPGASVAGALSAGAALGVAVLVFQEGALQGVLGFDPGPLQLGAVACGFAAVAAVTGARTIMVAQLIGDGSQVAVSPRLAQAITGPAHALSTVLLVAVGAGLLVTGEVAAKELGALIAVGAAVDLLIVRALIVPALTRL